MRGFTLTEIMIVIAMLGIIAGFSSIMSFDQYRDTSLRAARSQLVAALEHARAQAMSGVCTGSDCTQAQAHGIEIETGRYVIFQGETFVSRDPGEDDPIEVSPSIRNNGTNEIVFEAFSGDVAGSDPIVLTDPTGKTATITVGEQGQIAWSH